MIRRSFPTLLLALLALSATAAETLPFVKDDFPKAVALSKAKNIPIFVEAWAPW
ncbi:MAG TPA: hypothetical protein VGF48_18815 [Thermoanaerobaculia bacterium]|jgi:hypothetical protein